MDRFKFRAPSSSGPSTSGPSRPSNQTTNWSEKPKTGTEPKTGKEPKNLKKSNNDNVEEDDLWNDEIDEMTLLQASQIGDTVAKVSVVGIQMQD